MRQFQVERISLAVQAYATAQRCLDLTLAWVRQRVTFGRPLISRQLVRHRLVDMASRIELAAPTPGRSPSGSRQATRWSRRCAWPRTPPWTRARSWWTRPCSCTAAWATCGSPKWSGTTGTRGFSASAAAATEVLAELAARRWGFTRMTTLPARSTRRPTCYRDNRAAMLDQAGRTGRRARQGAGRRRSEVRRPAPQARQTPGQGTDRAAAGPGQRVPRTVAAGRVGHRVPGRRQRRRRHRRDRGRRVPRRGQRPDRARRREQPVDAAQELPGQRDRRRQPACRWCNSSSPAAPT